MGKNISSIVLSTLLLSIMLITPLISSQASNTNTVHTAGSSPLLGGPKYEPPIKIRKYDPVATFNLIASKVDRNSNGIEDSLEKKLSSLNSNDTIKINIIFGAKPAAFGGNKALIVKNLISLMKIVESMGGKIRYGPWKNALVGFSAEVPASTIKEIAAKLSNIDIDGDGTPDRLLIEEDKPVHAFNHWSSKQMNLRPYVWNTLNVRGQGVTVAVIDTGIDGNNSAFPTGKIVYWADYVGDPNGNKHDTPYDDNMHGTHVAGTVAGYYDSFDDQGRFVLNFGISDLDWSNAPTGQ